MKRLIAYALSGAIGVAICVGVAIISQALQLIPRVPAPGGEDDFSFRAAMFFFGMCPAFAMLGTWISALSEHGITAAARSWVGATCGSFLVMLLARVLRTRLEGLTAHGDGNLAIALLFAFWVIAAAAGAYFLRPRRGQSGDA